ncbi:Hypothetical protein CINCED_3A023499 [Cinara cedri]|uniref:THAP9-like helix-turn-helix domain-containing protein n=1 Tax=Cinara cedri TaxID=506608 RepID=A0A5E4N5U1_9HEMI|nr:Hypothetical protein CINCED_3A023499 [Cinara cedri]
MIPDYSYICSSHFTKDDYANSRLRVNALPKLIITDSECSESIPLHTIFESEQCLSSFITIDSNPTNSIINNDLVTSDTELRTPQENVITIVPEALFGMSNSTTTGTTIRPPEYAKLVWKPSHVISLTKEHFSTPSRAERSLNLVKQSHKAQNKKIKILTQSNRRLLHKINKLKHIAEDLENRCKLSEHAAHILNSCDSSVLGELVSKTKKGKFSPELFKFAETLQSHSAEAYSFVRSTFQNCLPHPKSINRWSRVVNSKQNFNNEAVLDIFQNDGDEKTDH